MNKINSQFKKIKAENRLGLMTHVVVGYPSIEKTRELVLMMVEEGVDYIELQIPFSDPIGDGPTIRTANTTAIKNGIRVQDAFSLVKRLIEEDGVRTPLLFMTYYNIVFNYGVEKFCKNAKEVGISGLIIPDYNLEHEKYEKFDHYANENSLALIRFISLDSDQGRMKDINNNDQSNQGFIYCFSTRGITGTQGSVNNYLDEHLGKAKNIFSKPLAVGFGINSADKIHYFKGKADIVIVGTAIIQELNQNGLNGVKIKIKEFIKALQ